MSDGDGCSLCKTFPTMRFGRSLWSEKYKNHLRLTNSHIRSYVDRIFLMNRNLIKKRNSFDWSELFVFYEFMFMPIFSLCGSDEPTT